MDLLEKARVDKADVFLKTAGINVFTVEKDIKAAESIIGSNEKIYLMAAGKLAQFSNDRFLGIGSQNYTGTDTKGVIIVTDKKVAFVDKRVFGKQSTIIEAEKISSIQNASGIISGRIIIKSFGDQYDITDLKKEAAAKAVIAVKKLLSNVRTNSNKVINNVSAMEEIKKAKALLDDGIISEEEFKKIKTKYLG